MKKGLILCLAALLALGVFAGCEKDEGQNLFEESNYDVVSAYVPTESQSDISTENSTVSADETVEGEFTIKVKKYDFQGISLALMSVKNGTNKNYTVTVKGTFLDKDGKVLQTETQSLDQYYAGYEGYFLFEPMIAFDSFTYEIETEETDGPFLARYVKFKYDGLDMRYVTIDEFEQQGDFSKYPAANGVLRSEYTGTTPITIYARWIIMNKEGEIMAICSNVTRNEGPWHFEDAWRPFPMYQTTDMDWECPDEWNDFTAIAVLRDCAPDADYMPYDPDPKIDIVFKIEGSM